jgi:hypothetical protein
LPQEAVVALDNTTLCVEDAEGRATLAEREKLERMSRLEAETRVALASTHEDAEGFAGKNALLEDAIIGPPRVRH